jgi:hypothetical protein
MSYLGIKKVKGTEYVSYVKKFSLMGQSFRIHKHIGKNISTLDKKEFMKRNLDSISRMEFEIRKSLLENLDITSAGILFGNPHRLVGAEKRKQIPALSRWKLVSERRSGALGPQAPRMKPTDESVGDSYNEKLLLDIELMSIKIKNLLEIKEIKDAIVIEFTKEFIFNSNNIEGSKIPAIEVIKIIETGSNKHQNLNEVKEVYNSIEAMNYLQKGFKFNISSIKRLYYILTSNLLMQNGEAYPRGFKKIANVVNNMETVPPHMVLPRLRDLLDRYKEDKFKIHPLKLAMDLHLDYEEIHPFMDGNGRTGRMLMNKVLLSHGYFPMIIHSVNSRAYFNSISKGLSGKNRRTYYQFMLEQARKTYHTFYSIIEDY